MLRGESLSWEWASWLLGFFSLFPCCKVSLDHQHTEGFSCQFLEHLGSGYGLERDSAYVRWQSSMAE